jgi:hypothetical protein
MGRFQLTSSMALATGMLIIYKFGVMLLLLFHGFNFDFVVGLSFMPSGVLS